MLIFGIINTKNSQRTSELFLVFKNEKYVFINAALRPGKYPCEYEKLIFTAQSPKMM